MKHILLSIAGAFSLGLATELISRTNHTAWGAAALLAGVLLIVEGHGARR